MGNIEDKRKAKIIESIKLIHSDMLKDDSNLNKLRDEELFLINGLLLQVARYINQESHQEKKRPTKQSTNKEQRLNCTNYKCGYCTIAKNEKGKMKKCNLLTDNKCYKEI